ncbi:hypothetical protein Emag_004458 [Eimeria magna]
MAVACDVIRNKKHREIFGFESFNPVQSQCFDDLYNSDTSIVVSAPTGAGKTEAVVSRLKLLHALHRPSLALRFVAVSATATNIHEIGKWLQGSFREFNSSYRPVPLIPHVLGFYKGTMNGFVFDSCGVAVIMTSQESAAKWKELSSGKQLILSKMQSELVEHLNAEVAISTVCRPDDADLWLDSTFWGVQTPPARRAAAHAYLRSELDRLGLLFAFARHKKASLIIISSCSRTHPCGLWRDAKKHPSGSCHGAIWNEVADGFFLYDSSLYKLARSLRNRICWDATAQLTQLPGKSFSLSNQILANHVTTLVFSKGIGDKVSSQLSLKGIESLDELAGAEADALAACCHKNVKIEHLLGLRMMCAKLPRFVVTLQPKGELVKATLLSFDLQFLCKELVGLDITEELVLSNLPPPPTAALFPRGEATAQRLPNPPLALATRQPEIKGPSGPVAVHAEALHVREEQRLHVEGLPQRGDSDEVATPQGSWMDELAFPQPPSACLSTQNKSGSRERNRSKNADAAAPAVDAPAVGSLLDSAAPAAAAAAEEKPRQNPQLQSSPTAQQATRMHVAHAEDVSDAGGLHPSRLLPTATSANRVETSGEPISKKPRKEMNFVFLEELDI